MGYNFSTIDGLFRPNYRVYNSPSSEVSESESTGVEPVLATYKPKDVHRIKSLIREVPQEDDGSSEDGSKKPTQYEMEFQIEGSDQKRFKEELDKFISENPEYRDIKDSLYNLAALESAFKMGVTNKAGSGALGWFQFMDGTRYQYNTQSREEFAKDPQAQLLAAAQYYTKLQQEVGVRGGDPDDFVTMYGAWWRPESAYAYIKNPNYDFKTKYNESFQQILQRARNIVNGYGKSNS